MSENCYLYRCYDEKEKLLYVGISISTMRRMSEHKRYSNWYGLVRYITVDECRDRKEAEHRELVAIRTEFPQFNKAGVVNCSEDECHESHLERTREGLIKAKKRYLETIDEIAERKANRIRELENEIRIRKEENTELDKKIEELRLEAVKSYQEQKSREEEVWSWERFITKIKTGISLLKQREKADPDPIIFL